VGPFRAEDDRGFDNIENGDEIRWAITHSSWLKLETGVNYSIYADYEEEQDEEQALAGSW